MQATQVTIASLSQAEQDLLIMAMRSHSIAAVDFANQFDRAYGPADGRAKEAWTRARITQQALTTLGNKLGLPV